ncbi:cell adhesion molecule CEACAM7-like isoform X5 [Mixophyes fleayi]|uniref:cell adhesion molecule CEACAM7-like isoform X5 n=1 Tax=Mixophyes fleayi TaxID=3061075 RepID=UPI003F4DDCF9
MWRWMITVLLSPWIDLTSGLIDIQLIPPYAVTPGSVTLSITGITGRILHFSWFKGPDTSSHYHILTYIPFDSSPLLTGPQFMSRISTFPNGSLLISDLLIIDQERVNKPVITASQAHIQEYDAVNLTCVSDNADRIIWRRPCPILQCQANISSDNRTITFSKIERGDAGDYLCEAENLISKSTSDLYSLTVLHASEYSPDSHAAVITGIICGTILGTVSIISVTYLLSRRWLCSVREESSIDRQDPCATYDNVLDLAIDLQVKSEGGDCKTAETQ